MTDLTTYRKLTGDEIAVLKSNGCSAADWALVTAAEGFVPDSIGNCRFAGTVKLGRNVTIDGVRRIENYEIGHNATLLGTESLVCTGRNAFGNGVRAAVLNESGGREVVLYNGLTSQIAYISAFYRHRPEIARHIERLVEAEIRNNRPESGRIGAGTYVARCGALTDIRTGENAVLLGVAELSNGTVNSTPESPTTIGQGVIARDFVVADGAEIIDFSHIEKCFVGQGCRIGKGFTAVNSLFFANCECEQGEACAVFAGPYTVTHHKSTLLIGGLFSFFNAGSNSNQSNHMYRLGPVHQGVLERGCKTGSGSYLLFPARIGAFSVVTGRHFHHPDTSLLPFSLLLEENGRTVLLPGACLKGVGLARDGRKWPRRDRRKGIRRDHVIPDTLNPHSIEKIFEGLRLLESFDPGRDAKFNGVTIPADRIEQGCKIYRTALEFYWGKAAAERLESGKNLNINEKHYDSWCDLSGLIAPREEVERLLGMVPEMHSIHELSIALNGLFDRYGEWEWSFAVGLSASASNRPVEGATKSDWRGIIEKGISAAEKILNWQLEDAAREFAGPMRVGYGIDGGEPERDAEFTAIHGTPETHTFLEELRREWHTEMERMRRQACSLGAC